MTEVNNNGETTMNKLWTDYFTLKERENGDRFYLLTDDAPDVLKDFMREEIHQSASILPDDWLYRSTHGLFCEIDETTCEDRLSEIADENVDIYNHDLLEWAKSSYAQEVIQEYQDGFGGKEGLIEQIMHGQWLLLERMAHDVQAFVKEHAEDEKE